LYDTWRKKKCTEYFAKEECITQIQRRKKMDQQTNSRSKVNIYRSSVAEHKYEVYGTNPKVYGTINKIYKLINKIAAQGTQGSGTVGPREDQHGASGAGRLGRSTEVNRDEEERTRAKDEEEVQRCGYGGGNPSCEALRARMWLSPALHETHPAKHRVVPTHEGSSGQEDRSVRDGGGERNERTQTNHIR